MATGTVKWFNLEKRFGFIASENDGDVFVHGNQVEACTFGQGRLAEGQRVEFDVADSPKGKRATHVRVVGT